VSATTPEGRSVPPGGGDAENPERGTRRSIVGLVTSNAMDKTVVVTVVRKVRDKRFHKFIQRRMKFKAHDESNGCEVGDKVELIESKPLSKTKRWRVWRTLEKAGEGAR
jgi:small subunit ribosomal protein S17